MGPSKEELMDILAEIDEDGSGEIEFAEFCQLCAKFLVEDPDIDTMKRELWGDRVRRVLPAVRQVPGGGPRHRHHEEGAQGRSSSPSSASCAPSSWWRTPTSTP